MGAKRPDGSSAKTERVTFTRPAAERIAKVVRHAEYGDRDSKGLTFSPRGSGGSARKTFRLGVVGQTWVKGTSATVTQLNPNGSELSPTVTFTAINHFGTVAVTISPKRVACAQIGATWILIAAEC